LIFERASIFQNRPFFPNRIVEEIWVRRWEVATKSATLEVLQNAPSEFRLSRMHSPEAVRDPG
jgi:hypothetical protein